MSNPYQAPQRQNRNSNQSVDSLISGPAIALIVVASIAIGVGILGLILDGVMLASGAVDELEAVNDGPLSEHATIAIRTIWGLVLLAASGFVLYGAIQMKRMKNYGAAKAASIVAVIPCLGPCCLLGIPFGIWALTVLGNPAVVRRFQGGRSRSQTRRY